MASGRKAGRMMRAGMTTICVLLTCIAPSILYALPDEMYRWASGAPVSVCRGKAVDFQHGKRDENDGSNDTQAKTVQRQGLLLDAVQPAGAGRG
jgi:hypothetical protein